MTSKPTLHEPWRELAGSSTIPHKPFKDLTDAEKGALLLAHHEGKRIEHYVLRSSSTMRGWEEKLGGEFYDGVIYRIAPEPKTPDTINWEHVAPEYNFMARDRDGNVWLYGAKPQANGDIWCFGGAGDHARTLSSYRRGTVEWKDSIVIRPGYEDRS